MRIIFFVVYLLSSFGLFAQPVLSVPFKWSNSVLNDVQFEKTSMHIPIRLENDSLTYYFQFDTGANKSFLYTKGNSNTSLINRCIKGDSIASNIGPLYLKPISSNSVYIKDGKTYIGTIGADVFKNKTIEIDFPNQTIQVLNSYNPSDYELMYCKGDKGRPTISLTIENKQYEFLYDTGSSLFDLCTTKTLWKKWKNPNSPIHEFPISSWGKIYSAYRTTLKNPLSINEKTTTQIFEVWYNSNKKFKQLFKKANVYGIVGNKPFLNDVILIDITNQKIGIRKRD